MIPIAFVTLDKTIHIFCCWKLIALLSETALMKYFSFYYCLSVGDNAGQTIAMRRMKDLRIIPIKSQEVKRLRSTS